MIVLFLVLAFSKHLDAACNYPADLIGSWTTSTLGQFTITSTSLSPLDVSNKVHTWECYLNNGNRYILRSEVYLVADTVELVMYRCLDIIPVAGSTDKFLYYQLTTENSQEGNSRVIIKTSSATPVEADICNDTTTIQDGAYSFLLKDNSLSSAKVSCPADLMTQFNVSMATDCAGGGKLDGCTDITVLNFNFTTCGGSTHTGDLMYTCLHSTVVNGNTFLTLYDNAAVSPANNFHCAVFVRSENYTTMTSISIDCLANQTPTNVTSPGFAMTLTNISTTVCTLPTTTTLSTTTVTTPATTVTTQKSAAAIRESVALWIVLCVCSVLSLNWC